MNAHTFTNDHDSTVIEESRLFLNDAELIGTPTPELDALLEQPVTFLTGELWGERDRRNTQDGHWKPVTMSWGDWIKGQPGDQNTPAWGFSRHPEGKQKEGSCIVLGSSIGGARKAKAMETMVAIGLDIDSGITYADAVQKVEELGLFCLAYTTFNHGWRGLQLKRDEVLRKLKIKTDPTLEEVKTYLREHSKSRYEESFIDAITIRHAKKQVKEGVVIDLDTPELEKLRLIFPLATPVKIIDLAETHDDALAIWEDKVTGLAVETLGVHFDTSCTDASRIFFTPRHPKGGDFWDCAIIQGKPLAFGDIPAMRKAAYTSGRDNLNAFELAGGADGNRPPACLTPSGKSLNDWHSGTKGRSGAKDRFMLANLLQDHCQDRIRVAGGEGEGRVHTECPWEHEHSEEGGTATMAINCLDSQNEYWTWFCHHDSCQGRHKLQFLEEALRQEWFDEELLTDMDAGYLLEGPDEEEEVPGPNGPYHHPLAPLYDERLVNGRGFLIEPEDAPSLYAEYNIKENDPTKAYKRMVAIVRDQITEAMRARFDYVVFNGEAKAAIRTAPGREVTFYTEGALERLFRNKEVSYEQDDKPQRLKPATLFMYDRDRATYSRTCFEPDSVKAASAATEGAFNLWTGFAVLPVPGDWSKLRNHVRDVVCNGDEMLFAWFMTHTASVFARPGVKVPSSIAIKGEQGTGKSKFYDWIREAMGCSAMKVSQGKHIVGQFNGHLDGKLLLVAEEAFWAGDKAAAGVIKDLISADELTIEAKFENAVTRPNYMTTVFISNNDWIIPTDGADARRFLVLDVPSTFKEDAAYFGAIDRQMKSGGLEAMVHELTYWQPEEHGLTWESLRTPPKTDSLRQQAGMGLSGPMAALVGALEEGVLFGRTEDGDVFYYELDDDKPTRVARAHLNAILGIKKGRGNETVEGRKAVERLFGEGATHGNKDVVEYLGEMRAGDNGSSRPENMTTGRVRYVDVPALNDPALREKLAAFGRG